MKATEAAMAVLLILLALVWVPLRQIDADIAAAVGTEALLDRFSMAENAASREVLQARAGLLRNYDPLARDERALHELADALHTTPSSTVEQRKAVDAVAAAVDQQETLIERFKSSNALLQNSLAYFQRFGRDLGGSQDPATVAAVTALNAAMLQLTLDTSPSAAQSVADRLDQLAATPVAREDAAAKEALLAHGRMLHSLLPMTDGILAGLQAAPITATLETLRHLVRVPETASTTQANRLRLFLYGISLTLMALLLYFARGLRERARTLRERAAFDHAVARISISLLDAQPHEIEPRIAGALRDFATMFGAGRGYFLEIRRNVRTHLWNDPPAALPAGWPDAAPALAAALDPDGTGLIHLPALHRLPAAHVGRDLAEAGLRGWLCLQSTYGSGTRYILGLDALRAGRITDRRDLSFVRVALEVLANTAEKQALEQEKLRLATRLQQARRMEAIGALASGVAHNFNNLIGAILGHAEIAEGAVSGNSRVATNLAEIRNAGERARDLVEEILSFGRPRHREYVQVPLTTLIHESISLLKAGLPREVELVVGPVPEAVTLTGELAQLQQVIMNICNNAAQAMAGRGRIEVEIGLREVAEAHELDHGQLAPGRHVSICISDTGRGMTEEVLRRIFEPFYTTRQAGNGLGLATVRAIVIEHGGAISVRSTPGIGSRFDVWLPCSTEDATSTAQDTASSVQLETVLLVDEDRERLYRNEEILAAIGYEPVGFTRIADALTACRNAPRRFDAAILGPMATATALSDLASALSASVPDLPILAGMTAADLPDAPALALAGIKEVVSCPFDPGQIAAALRRRIKASPTTLPA